MITLYNFSASRKAKEFPIHYADQKGLCLYCSKKFTETFRYEYDHLNNNTHDNRIENHALVCHSCNNLKKGNAEMQVIASDKLLSNEKREYTRERIQADTGTTKEVSSQSEINKINTQITAQFILEHTINESVTLRDSCNAIVNICQENNGTGSQAAVYRYIDSLCNPFTGKYTIYCNSEGINCIRRRTEN